jgi:hypothetical protein
MRVFLTFLFVLITLPGVVSAQFRFQHTPENHWLISNGWIEAEFQFTERSTFEFVSLRNLKTGDRWRAHPDLPSSPIRFASERDAVDVYIPLRFVQESTEAIDRRGMRQNLVFDELGGGFRIFLALELYENQPVLRYSVKVRNLLDQPRRIRMADMLNWNFAEPSSQFRMLRVNQWSMLPALKNFEPFESVLASDFTKEPVYSGAGATDCAWMAVRDRQDRGLIAGWEFDGRAEAWARYRGSDGRLELAALIQDLNRYVVPGKEFQVPPAFIGVFRGDWDEAAFRTQRFVESVLAKPMPEDGKFPYVAWDSWGYETSINESLLRRNAEVAAKLGMEMFIVDLGWSRTIGDWRHDPSKFPNGLAPLSDYVHSLGMKFGLHLAIAEAALDSPVVRDHPEWLSTEPYSYFGAKGLCLSHKPVQEWLIQEIVRVIDEAKVDWILQDGEHLIKRCSRKDHTHDPDDSNYSNAANGLNTVIEAVQKLRPKVLWESCANGGSMMTFNMVKYYVTSITNDASGALGSRQAVYGATYPFPARYADRYMPENPSSTYETRSYMFGGPWVFMNRLAELTAAEIALAASEIRTYKELRPLVRDAKIFHLTDSPGQGRVDAIQAYSASSDMAVIVVTRDGTPDNVHVLRVEGLNPENSYRVRFQDDRRIYVMTGHQLAAGGVPVLLPAARSAEIVHIEPAYLALLGPDPDE